MIGPELVLTLGGTPATKGSLKCIGQGGRHRLIESNEHTKEWREAVARAASVSWLDYADHGQPIGIEITTTIGRPARHYTSGDPTRPLKASAPPYPSSLRTGDVDKYARLVLDALADAGTLDDDAQVVEVLSRKAYVDDVHTPDALTHPGVRIRVYPVASLDVEASS